MLCKLCNMAHEPFLFYAGFVRCMRIGNHHEVLRRLVMYRVATSSPAGTLSFLFFLGSFLLFVFAHDLAPDGRGDPTQRRAELT